MVILIFKEKMILEMMKMKAKNDKKNGIGEYSEYYGAAESPVRCGEVLPQLSVFTILIN